MQQVTLPAKMLEKEGFLFVFLLVLGTSITTGRYVEDSSEEQHADHEQASKNKSETDMEDDEDDGNGRDEEDDDRKEEVVKIQPGQSDEDEQEEEDSEEEGNEFGDESDASDDHMIEGDEGGRSLAGHEEDSRIAADLGGFENFKKTADEMARENENIQTEIRDLQDKFDQALSSDKDKAASDPARDAAGESQQDTSNSNEMSDKVGGEQNENNLIRQHAQIGEDANVEPDDDY